MRWTRPSPQFLQQAQPSGDPHHRALAALVSHQFGLGHACLDLATLAPALRDSAATLPWAQGDKQPPGARRHARAAAPVPAPQLERRGRPSARPSPRAWRRTAPCPPTSRSPLDQLFGAPAAPQPAPRQIGKRSPARLAARQRFTLITGGPGTGKTTVVRLLALLQADPARAAAPLRIALAAPTGKAAARLGESIAGAIRQLPLAMREHIPDSAVTLHKLLQVRGNQALDPVPALAVDLVVVDEASMIDLEMMARLLAAVPLGASLILLGDKDQLASVEAGAVMGQLCAQADQGRYTPATSPGSRRPPAPTCPPGPAAAAPWPSRP